MSRQLVVLVDNDLESLESMQQFAHAAGYSVATFPSGEEFLQNIHLQPAFCAVIEVNLPDISGSELLRALAARSYYLPLIFVASVATISTSVKVMKAGAVDFLIKPVDPQELLAAIREADRKYRKSLEAAAASNQFHLLTPREKEVFALVTTGMLNKQIAAHLGIAEKTIKVHRGRVMRKMEVQSVAELVRLSEKISSIRELISEEDDNFIGASSVSI